MAIRGQSLSTEDKLFGTAIMIGFGLGAIGLVVVLLKKMGLVDTKSAEMVELDGIELPSLPYADMAMTNAMMRPDTNVMLNHLYGGVPDPSPSGLIDYITGTPSFLQGAN